METEFSTTELPDDHPKFEVNLNLPEPDSQTSFTFKPTKKTDYTLVETIIGRLNEIEVLISRKIELIESLDISLSIISYKVYEATHDFKGKIAEIKEERNHLLTTIENRSELSLILNDLDQKISSLEFELEHKVNELNFQKIEFQRQIENINSELDNDISMMQESAKQLKRTLDVERGVAYRSQLLLINEKYSPQVEKAEARLREFEHLQFTGWHLENTEVKLAMLLEEQGLKFTLSGRLLTKTGSLLTFEEAQEKGYFNKIHTTLEKVFDFFKERHEIKPHVDEILSQPLQQQIAVSETSSVKSRLSSEEVKYLKEHVGKPLTLALAEITAKHPKDPIHYLGHYLFKYRYNQQLEEVQKLEIQELTRERKRVSDERWKSFVEAEARNAVMDMIIRAEEIAYQNELRRIELEQMLAQEEEEHQEEEDEEYRKMLEEARDKFE